MFDFKELKSDRSLILAIRKKDQESFTVLYHRYRPLLFAVSFRLCHSREDAEDALQDTFLVLWHNPEQVDPDKNIRSFLCSCVKNRTENLLKKRNQSSYQDYESLIDLVGQSEDSNYLEMLECIRKALSKKEYDCFVLHEIYGYTFDEIGTMTGLTGDAVSSLEGRAKKKIRKLKEVKEMRKK